MSIITNYGSGDKPIKIFSSDVLDDIFGDFENLVFSPLGSSVFSDCFANKKGYSLIEKENEFIFKVEVPGFSKEEINAFVEERDKGIALKIKAKKIDKEPDRKEAEGKIIKNNLLSNEGIEFSYLFPGNFNTDKLNSELKEGVLTIILPKSKEKNGTKVIKVN